MIWLMCRTAARPNSRAPLFHLPQSVSARLFVKSAPVCGREKRVRWGKPMTWISRIGVNDRLSGPAVAKCRIG